MLINKIFYKACAFICLMFVHKSLAAQCKLIDDLGKIDYVISQDQCVVLNQNQNLHDINLIIKGKFRVQTNRQLNLTDSKIYATHNADIIIRGGFSLEGQSYLALDQNAHLKNLGTISIKNNAFLYILGKASLTTASRFSLIDNAKVIYSSKQNFENKGYFFIQHAHAYIDSEQILNYGNIYLEDEARVFLQNNAYIQNHGLIDISLYSMLELKDNSTLDNYKSIDSEGIVQCYKNASIENKGQIMLNTKSMFIAYDNSYLDNQKNLENGAAMIFVDNSQIDNSGNFIIKQDSLVKLMDASLAKNKGTWRNIGSFIHQDTSFINTNIYFDDQELGAH